MTPNQETFHAPKSTIPQRTYKWKDNISFIGINLGHVDKYYIDPGHIPRGYLLVYGPKCELKGSSRSVFSIQYWSWWTGPSHDALQCTSYNFYNSRKHGFPLHNNVSKQRIQCVCVCEHIHLVPSNRYCPQFSHRTTMIWGFVRLPRRSPILRLLPLKHA